MISISVAVMVLVPLACALGIWGISLRRLAGPVALLATLAMLAGSALIAFRVEDRGPQSALGGWVYVDSLGVVILVLIMAVGVCAVLNSLAYIDHDVQGGELTEHGRARYYALLLVFMATMATVPVTNNLGVMWVAIEATTVVSVLLVSIYRTGPALEAAWKYLLIGSVGIALALFGTMMTYYASSSLGGEHSGALSWTELQRIAAGSDPRVMRLAFIFVLVGYGTKAGLAPMHTWLPDAHSKAPSPISAMLSGALLNVALLAILRFKLIADAALGPAFSQNLLIFFGIISISIPAFIIIVQKNYKRLFAYSSIEHMGIVALGFGFGGLGSFAALLHMIYHSLAKSLLFFSAGNVLLKYGSTKIENIKGVLSAMPVMGTILLLGFLAITGVPPFGIFITEIYIMTAGIGSHPVAVGIALLLLALIFIGFLKYIAAMLFSNASSPVPQGEANYLTIAPPVLLLVVLAGIGFFLPPPVRMWIDSAAALIR